MKILSAIKGWWRRLFERSQDDLVTEELLNRVFTTGKAHVAHVSDDGEVTFEVVED